MENVPNSYYTLVEENKTHTCDPTSNHFCIRIESVAKLPSRFGNFFAVAFHQTNDIYEHAAFVKGDVVGKENVLVRMHSECLTGDGIGSLRCDCRDQLEGSLKKIEKEGMGVVLYLRQEGRGIGLTNKLKAYALQDTGLNTVEANFALGFDDDLRDYHIAAHMIKSLKIKSIKLMTNNPKKLLALQDHGINITERIEHIFEANEYNAFYLKTKKVVSNHLLDKNMSSEQYLVHQQY